MATEFLMPKLGLTMEEGTIVQWLVPDGGDVTPGMPVLQIETDKVESDVEAPAPGRLHRLGDVGDTFRCGDVIALLLDAGEEPPPRSTPTVTAGTAHRSPLPAPTGTPLAAPVSGAPVLATAAAPGRLVASPNARRVAARLGIDLRTVRGTGPGGRIVSEDVESAPVAPAVAATMASVVAGRAGAGSTLPATAAARQLADLLGVDLAAVPVDPADGRVTRERVAAHVRTMLRAASDAGGARHPTAGAGAPLTQQPTEVRRFTGMRGTIAKRMHASLQEMAQLTLFMDADLDAVVADRRRRQDGGDPPGFTDYVVAAAARALRAHPIVNAQVTDDGIALLPDVHVGVAVAVPAGLMVPVVRHADRLALGALAAETTRLAEAARAGALTLADLEGATFSVSALGMFGVDGFTPVVNPPNVAILGVGRIRDDVTVGDGAVGTTKRWTLSLTWDHRVLDGAPAAAFCHTIVELLADPARLDDVG